MGWAGLKGYELGDGWDSKAGEFGWCLMTVWI